MSEYRTPAELRLERAQALQMKRLEPQIRQAQNEQVQEALKAYKQAEIDAQIERSKKNFVVRGVSTVGDVVGNVITGALKGIEGIVDFGLAVDGALNPFSYLYDALFDGYRDKTRAFVEKDLVGTYVDAPMEEFLKYSYTKDGNVGRTIEDVASGVGQLIPAALAAYFTGGTSLAASGTSVAGMTVPQAVALGVTTTSAAGNATEQAYNEGAGDGVGLLYGVGSGMVEAATEKLTGGIGIYGKGLLNGVVKSTAREGVEAVAKTGVKRVISNAIGEAGEEVIAELANPTLKSIYKGRDAFEEYKDADYWRGVGHAGVVGGLTSIAAEGTVGRVTKTAGAYADAQSIFEELESIEKRAVKMDMDTLAKSEEKYNKSIKQNYLQLESVLKNAPSKQRADIIKKYGLSTMFTDGGSMQADFAKQLDTGTEAKYNKRYYNRAMRNNEGIIESDLERINGDLANKYDGEVQTISVFDGELSEKGRAAASKVKKLIDIASEKSGKNIGFVITDGNVQQFRGVNVGDRIYMSADTFEKGDAYEVAVEETMHFAEGSEEHNALVKLLAEDGDLEARAVDAVLGADGYGFDGEAIRDIGRRIEAGEKVSERERIAYEEYQNEVSAHMGAELLGNEKVIERIIREDSSLAEKILGKIIAFKEALGRIGDPEAQAQHKRLAEAERMYLDAIEAAGKKYVNGKIVSANDDEEKENTAEGGGKYSFAGPKAKTADKMKLATAQEMLEQGVDSETVRKETGWFRGYDGKWRFEISDFEASLIENPNLEKHIDDGEVYFTGKLSDILDHKELFEAYPELKDINIVIQKTDFGVYGIYQPNSNYITLSIEHFKRATKEYHDYANGGRKAEIERIEATPEYQAYNSFYEMDDAENMDPEEWLRQEKELRDRFFNSDLGKRYYQLMWGKTGFVGEKYEFGWGTGGRETLLHELQHAIQRIEGFASGTSTRDANYSRNAGELEARDVEVRANLTAEERKNHRPDYLDQEGVVFADNEGANFSIVELDNGKQYVVASESRVIKGNDQTKWAQQVADYINNIIRNYTDFVIKTTQGDFLTITRDTAYKAGTRNQIRNPDGTYRSMTDAEYRVKLNAEVHINELSEISRKRNRPNVPDGKNHRFAKDGFSYRTAYFKDFDGSYYRLTISVGENGSVSTVYNVGKIDKDTLPNGKIKTIYSGSKANSASINISIPQNPEKSTPKAKFSLKGGDPAKRVQPASAEEMIANAMASGMGADSQTYVKADSKKDAEATATKRPTSYTKEEARAMVDRMLEILSFEGTRAKMAGSNLTEVINRAHTLLNSAEAGKRGGVALNFADYVIDHAILVDDADPWQMQPYIETVDILKPYLHQLDLRGLEEEILHHYDNDTSVYARWKAPKGKTGMSLESVAEELAAKGYKLSHKATADILFELDQDYRDAVQMLRKGANTMVREAISKAERKKLQQEIAKSILNSFDNRDFSRATLTRIANSSLDAVERYKAENQRLAKENRALERERARLLKGKAAAEARIERDTLQRREMEGFDQVKNRVLKAVKGIANWKKGVFESAAEANGDALKGVIGELSRIENKGNISATGTRKAMKAISDWYARPDKHPIVRELQESKLYDEGVLDLMNEIGDDEKIEKNAKLSAAELANVEIVIRHFKHIVENYHRVFRDGKYVEAKPLVEKFIKIAEENAKIQTVFGTKVMESRFYEYFGDVESIMKWNDRYNEDGFFTTTFRELREGAYRMSVAQMEMRQELDEWLERKENKRFLDSINERTVEVRGLTMSAAEAMSLYMTTKREQAQGGILDAGFSVRDRKTGTLHSAEGLLRAAYAESGEVDLLAAQREMLNFRDELWKGFSDKERAYIQMAEKIFNGECKTRKARTDEVRLGYSNVSEDYYFPIRRGHLAQKVGEDTLGGEVQRIKSLSFNKNIVQGSKGKLYIEPINNVLDRHIAGIALYENISIPIDNFNRMFNMDVSGNKNDPRTIATITSGDGGWADAKSYIDKLIKDIEGIRSEDKWASDTLKFIRSGFVRFQLGANPKTWWTQGSSLFAAMSMVDPKYMAKAMTMKANGADLDKYSPLAKLRNSENTAVIAQGVIDKVGRVGDALMVPIGKVDRYVVTRLWNACQLQVEAEQGLKMGTEENKVAAGKMLEKVIFETQQNSLLTERSAAMRSSNELIKGLTMFSADGMKITGRVLDAFGRVSVIKAQLKNAEGKAKTALETELKAATKEFRRASAAMVSTAIYMSLIAYAFSHLYGKRDDDETVGEAALTFLGDFVGNLLGGLPLIRDIYSYIVDGYELNNYALSSVNDLLSGASGLISLAGDIINGREVTSQQIATKTKAALFGVGQLFGIPLRNAYNVGRGVIGLSGLITGNGNSIGYAWDSLFYDKSYRSDLNKAMEKGDEKMVAMIADLMVNESFGTIDAKSREAIKSLIGEGYDVLPRSVSDSVTYDGEEYEFTARSRKRFEEVYGIADEAVKDLVSMSKFSSADAAVQAKAIRFIYDVYYNLALEDFLGVDIENKTVLFAQALDIEKLALIVATARSIEGDKDRNGKTINGSKKLKVVKYIESLRMTAAEKYMIMGYLGYKNVNGEAAVRSYINKLSLTKQEKTKLLSYSGYAA